MTSSLSVNRRFHDIIDFSRCFVILTDSDLKFTLPVIRNKSKKPKIHQKYFQRSPLNRLHGNIDGNVIFLFTYFVEHFDVRRSEV